MNPKHSPGPPMTLGNMRKQGVRNLIGYCLNDACRHWGLIDVSGYPRETRFLGSGQARTRHCLRYGGPVTGGHQMRSIKSTAALLTLSILASLSAAHAEQTGKVPRIGFIGSYSAPSVMRSTNQPLLAALHDLGYDEGRNVIFRVPICRRTYGAYACRRCRTSCSPS